MSQQFTITEFVRGLALHDIGKPFALPTKRHTNLGYWLLKLGDAAGEALVALTHGANNKALKEYLTLSGQAASLPAVSLLNNPLDRLAASAYSLQTRDLGRLAPWHSLQNPFTRFPIPIVAGDDVETGEESPGKPLTKPPIPRVAGGSKTVKFKDIAIQWERPLWEAAVNDKALPAEWRTVLTDDAKQRAEAEPQTETAPLPAAADALAVLCRAMTRFPERTYPAVNDTSLTQHGRLAGILGFVVYRNLEREEQATWLEGTITLEGSTLKKPNDPQGAVRQHLTACLVRVTFEGARYWSENAARVDDLLGSLALAGRLRGIFKDTLAEQMHVPELSHELTISEGQFELSYLLPYSEDQIRSLVRQAYEEAIHRLTDDIIRESLRRDFSEPEAYRADLEQQLTALPYGLRVLLVEAPRDNRFDHFAAKYGHALLQAYLDSQRYIPIPDVVPANTLDKPLPVAETCDVCGMHPVWQPPEGLDDVAQAAWLQKRNFAAHIFRGEREQVCVSCAARRELAFGAIAKRLDDIVHPLFKPGERHGLWHAVQPDTGPDRPPLLAAAVDLEAKDKAAGTEDATLRLLDAGACFVRYKRTAAGVNRADIDLFPTVSYAADANGNVALLTLSPTPRLFEAYAYQTALGKCAQFVPDNQDAELWKKAFADFVTAIEKEGEADLAPLHTVEPHLARVMERITWIKRFYGELAKQLQTEPPPGKQRPLRVLPLDVDYPTLRLLVPADRLDDALRTLDRVVTKTLFSATCAGTPAERETQHEFLSLITPDLLHGAVILFKHKFPLYLALEAERDLFRRLAVYDQKHPGTEPDRPSRSDWYGFRLAFSDLRGSLSEVGPLDATVTYRNLGQVLDLVTHVDRPTLLQYAETRQHLSADLAQAQAMVRANHISRTQVRYVEQLQDEMLFNAVYFITRAIRR